MPRRAGRTVKKNKRGGVYRWLEGKARTAKNTQTRLPQLVVVMEIVCCIPDSAAH